MSRTSRPLRLTAPAWSAAVSAALLLAACSGTKRLPGDDQPTLASLGTRTIKVTPDNLPVLAEEQTIAAYRQFLASSTPAQQVAQAPQRAEALRRLGDLEMDLADRVASEGAGSEPDYKAAITQYEGYLQAHPKDPGNHRVLYQLARAQEQGGQLEAALKTLSSLVTAFPGTQHAEEAQFRRGELLFAMRDYAQAEGWPTPPCCRPARPRPSRNVRSTCRAGRSSNKAGWKKVCSRFSACSTSSSAACRARRVKRPIWPRSTRSNAPTVNWWKTVSAS